MSMFHNEMEAAAKLSYGSAQADPKTTTRSHSVLEDKEDLRITINNNRLASLEARQAPRYSSTISGALSEWDECREGSLCHNFGTNKCHCYEESRAASVIHDGHWQPQEPTEAETEAVRPKTLKIDSVFHNCRECGATHRVPGYQRTKNPEAALEADQRFEAETLIQIRNSKIEADEAKSVISIGSSLEEVLNQETMQVDPGEEDKVTTTQAYPEMEDEAEAVAMADPLDTYNFKQEWPEIEIVQEVINLADSSDEESDHLPDTEDEEEAMAYGRLIRETLFWPGGIHHLHVIYPVPYTPIRREI